MDLLVVTVPHSGSFRLLELLDYERRGMHDLTEADSGLLFGHLWDMCMPRVLDLASRMPVITTWRDPEHIRQSWRNRGKDLTELEREHFPNYAKLMELKPYVVKMWTNRNT